MKCIEINTTCTSHSKVLIGERLVNLSQYLPADTQTILLVEEHVEALYSAQLKSYTCITVPCGEENKVISTVERLVIQLLNIGADRSTFLVGIGGGITGDITGFTASIFMRGVGFGLVSTTLLSQLDASVGGKNGVNLQGYKNMLGTFNQPEFVICDQEMLKTLPEREFRAGLAELVKAALIADASLFTYIKQNRDRILSRDLILLEELIGRGVTIKAAIVRQDERETGERRKLNLGHTFAHAIEKHSSLNHGEAVSVGLVIAASISQKLGLLTEQDVLEIKNLLALFNLPVETEIPKDLLLDAIQKDKKKQGDSIRYILMKGIGSVEVRKISFNDLSQLL